MDFHSDRSNDDVRAAKDSPPLCGRAEKAAGGVEPLDRTTDPAFGPLLASRLLRAIPTPSGPESRP